MQQFLTHSLSTFLCSLSSSLFLFISASVSSLHSLLWPLSYSLTPSINSFPLFTLLHFEFSLLLSVTSLLLCLRLLHSSLRPSVVFLFPSILPFSLLSPSMIIFLHLPLPPSTPSFSFLSSFLP